MSDLIKVKKIAKFKKIAYIKPTGKILHLISKQNGAQKKDNKDTFTGLY